MADTQVENFNWDIIGLNETKVVDTEVCVLENESLLLTLGNGVKRKNGVGFLIRSNLIPHVECFVPYSDRLCMIKIRASSFTIVIIQVYLPTNESKEEEVDKI